MAYIVVKPTPDQISELTEDGDRVAFTFFDQGLQVNLGQSFFRFNGYFDKYVGAFNQPAEGPFPAETWPGGWVPCKFGDLIHMNDKFTDSLWRRVRFEDTQNNITIETGQVPHLQCIAMDLIKPAENFIGGIGDVSKPALYITAPSVQEVLINYNPALWNVGSGDVSPYDFEVGFNLDDILNSQYARWGESLTPFPLPYTGTIVGNASNYQANITGFLTTMRNRASLTRLKRIFLYNMWSNSQPIVDQQDYTELPYMYKPSFCDVWDGKQSYWTNRFRIELTRGSIWNSVQVQTGPVGGLTYNQPKDLAHYSALEQLRFHIKDLRLILFTFANVTKAPRTAIWMCDQFIDNIISPMYMRDNLVKGSYDSALISLVKNTSFLNNTNKMECVYKSGLDISLFPQVGTKPNNALKRFYFKLDFGDSNKIRVPDNEQYEIFRADGIQGSTITQPNMLMLYLEYLRMCKVNPFNPEGKRVKIDYMSFLSQMMYIPISFRKDREYFKDEPNQTISMGLVAEFDSNYVPNTYSWVITAFKRIIL